MSSSDSDAELFYDAEDVSPSSHGRHQDEEPAPLGMTLGVEEEEGVREREAAARRARDMEIRRQKLEAMRNQLSDESPRERSRGHHNSGQDESRGQFRENEMCLSGNTNDCNKSDSGVNVAMETPLNVAMETMNIRTDSGPEKHGIVGSELDVNVDDMRLVTDIDNLNLSDGHDKKVCCKVVSELVSGVDVTSLRRSRGHGMNHDGDTSAILHSKQPDIVKSVLPFHKVEPVAPPRRKKKKQAPPPPQMRRDDRKEAPLSITPPGVEAVKEMPLPSTSSDCSDLDSTPNFSLTEDIDRSKVTITDDPEQSLDISAATQGSRMVTAVEDSSCRAGAVHDPIQGDNKGQHDDDPSMTQTNRPGSHDSGDDVVGSSSAGEHQVPLMMQRPRSNSGSRFLSDKEILDQVKVVNLDTGEELPLSLAEEKLPTCVNPLSLHIMRRTKEYSRLLEFLHNMQSERRPCDCRRRAAHSVDRSTTVVLRRSVLSRTGSDSSLHKRHLGSDEEEQHDRRSDFGARTLNTVTLAKRKGVKLRRMLGKTVNKIKHVADEVFHGEDNSASDDDDLTDGRRMIKIKAASVHKGPYDFDLLVPVQDLSGEHMGAVWTMKFSPCGRLLATGGQDKMLRVWVLKEACSYFIDMRHKYMYTQGGVSRVSPAPSQDSINSQSDATSDTSATEAHREEREEDEDAHAPFMKKPFCVYKGHTGDLLDISWSKNYFVLSSSMDKTVRLWHASRRECLCCFQHIDFVTAIAFHPKDDRYFLSGSLDGKLRLWSIPDKKVALWNEVGGQSKLITAVNFCMNGKFAVVGTYDGLCVFYSTEQLKYYTQIHVRSTRGKNARGRKITGLEPFPGEDKLLVTSNDSRVRIYDLRDLTLTCKYKGGANNSSQIKASFSHDGKYIICGSEDQAVYIWRTQHDVTAGRRDRNSYWESIKAHLAVVTVAIFSPSPHLIIRPQFESVESNATEEKPDASSLDSQGEALVSADFSGAIKVFINKFKPSAD